MSFCFQVSKIYIVITDSASKTNSWEILHIEKREVSCALLLVSQTDEFNETKYLCYCELLELQIIFGSSNEI